MLRERCGVLRVGGLVVYVMAVCAWLLGVGDDRGDGEGQSWSWGMFRGRLFRCLAVAFLSKISWSFSFLLGRHLHVNSSTRLSDGIGKAM